MIEYEIQLKIQSWVDGELSDREARKVEALVAREPEAQALLQELRQTNQSLSNFENAISLPENGQFFWSKIRRQIDQLDPAPAKAAPESFFASLHRLLVPATALAVVAVVSIFAALQSQQAPSPRPPAETALADSSSFTYHDFSSGTTVVWLSYPADNEIADNMGSASIE